MKTITLLLSVCLSSGLWGQSLREANKLFNKYEYSRSTEMFAEIAKTRPLPVEDYKRLGYGYFIIGDFKNCLPISDSIVKMNQIEPFFYYMNGEANFGEGNYEVAKASFVKYESLDNEYNVENKIKSCDLIREAIPADHLKNELLPGNNSKANITGEKYFDEGVIEFNEVGQDSSGAFVDASMINEAELVLARPFVRKDGEDRAIISLEESFRDAAISSFTLNEATSEVWVTVARPLSKEQLDKVPHLYKGIFDKNNLSISELIRWEYSGYEDSTACAHASINHLGNKIVFSKIGKTTQGADLYMSSLKNGTWSTPTPLSAFNSREDEMYPMFIDDSLFTFSSDGHPGYGGLDIFKTTIEGDNFGKMQHLLGPVNGARDDFNYYYYSKGYARYTSNRVGGAGDDDMYAISYEVEPVIVDPPVVPDSSDFYAFVKSFKAPIFYFRFDKFDLRDSVNKLDQLVEFLANNKNSKIIVEGHTDKFGTHEYNLKLSKNRALSLKEALVKKGIAANQIETVGLANTQPLNKCDWCSPAMNAENRYARIKLVAK